MGAFLLVTHPHRPDLEGRLARMRRQIQEIGLPDPIAVVTTAYSFDYYPKSGAVDADFVDFPNGDFIASVGTLVHRGRIGRPALSSLFAAEDIEKEIANAHGHFALVTRRGGRTRILLDPLGSYEVFHDAERRIFSTSFLAVAQGQRRLVAAVHEVYEYVFAGVTLGTETPFGQIRRLDIGETVQVEPELRIERRPAARPPAVTPASRDEVIESVLSCLDGYVRMLVDVSAGKICQALSGGYDSRLLLALFRRSGFVPRLFVYGKPHGDDVLTARAIAGAEGLYLDYVDKDAFEATVDPDVFPAVARRNYLASDGLPWDGIMNGGAEWRERQERCRGGVLHVNGGGGEIFRNFFNLPDRDVSVRQFVCSFYARTDPSYFTRAYSGARYVDGICRKVRHLVGTEGDRLPRQQVEWLYPNLRCRSWFGKENSVNNRFGYSVLPFYDAPIVGEALSIPVRYKAYGNFESRLIRRADRALAAHPSNYGHGFAGDAPWWATLKDWLGYRRPSWIRRSSFALKNRLTRQSVPRFLAAPYVSRVIDPSFPFMSRYFRTERVTSPRHRARLCTIEHLFEKFDPELP